MKAKGNQKEYSFFDLFEKFVRDSRSGRRLQPNGKRLTAGTIRNYCYTMALIRRFCQEKSFPLRIKGMGKMTAREVFVERNYWRRFYRQFTEYMYRNRGFFDNYAGLNIKNIRTFFNYLNKELLIQTGDFHRSFYVRKEDISIFPLLPEELNYLIYDEGFERRLSQKMRQVKDIFVFGCTVALRYSDLIALTAKNIREANGTKYLAVRSKKTNLESLVKLPPYAEEIIEKYRKKSNGLLPYMGKSILNKSIKLLLELAGFTHPVSVCRSRQGTQVALTRYDNSGSYFRFCDVATTHTMRRTAITTMLSLGMPEALVRKISGHTPGSKEFYRYVSWSQAYQDREVDEIFEKLRAKRLTMTQSTDALFSPGGQ